MQLVQESPLFVQTSLAGALCLGMEKGRFMPKSECKCLNLLLTYNSGCRASCSYCGLAKNRQEESSKTFIRVKWPVYSLQNILDRIRSGNHPFKRVCISMITHGRAVKDTCGIISQVREYTQLPVSVLIAPTVMKRKEDLTRFKAAGADRVGVAIDAATEELFVQHRGAGVSGPHHWDHFWHTLGDAVEIFGQYQVGVHLIVGLGETEAEMVRTIAKVHQMGALTHLFSFYPESGSLLQDCPPPDLGQYRRVQMARYLIDEGLAEVRDFQFSAQAQIMDFGKDIMPIIRNGEAFMTSGCPGEDGQVACNRPFGNERASDPMRNYPFLPEAEDIDIIIPQLWNGVKQEC
ncbi:radical SAM protein [Desulfosporosinus sp. FKB]|uniref:radical SAM protein n=1 Tax=Desulfosporosinus sp. FKB TaxID=1969835 RepID=UPI000B4970B2|nr:radical SAM protein [Desulfosporosinus sp. FKB]